jgi:hypothetical protein
MEMILLKPKTRPYVFLIDGATNNCDTAVVILRLTSIARGVWGDTRQNRTIAYQDIALGFNHLDNFREALSQVIAGARGTTANVESSTKDIWRLTRLTHGVHLAWGADSAILPSVELPIADALALVSDIPYARSGAETYIEKVRPELIVLREKFATFRAKSKSRANETLPSAT